MKFKDYFVPCTEEQSEEVMTLFDKMGYDCDWFGDWLGTDAGIITTTDGDCTPFPGAEPNDTVLTIEELRKLAET